nr:RNA polymerase sigma-70 factor [Pedobacter sp. ASV19]
MSSYNTFTDYELADLFKTGDRAAFTVIYQRYWKKIFVIAAKRLGDAHMAEEIVQNMFMRFWEKRELLNIDLSVKAYLYKCVHNDTLNYLKHEKVKARYQEHAAFSLNYSEPASHKAELNELEWKLQEALKDLPEQCRTIFQMSRFEELKYREIAEQLGLSIKTIENQMGKALRILRLKLVDFLALILIGIIFYKDFLN